MIRAIFLDLDGTLLHPESHAIPPEALAALLRAREANVRLAVATGRNRADTRFLDRQMSFDAYVTINGQYCLEGETVVFRRPIPRSDMEIVYRLLQTQQMACGFSHADGVFCNRIDEWVLRVYRTANMPLPPVLPLEAILGREIYQVQPYVPVGGAKVLLDAVPGLESARWSPDFVDVYPRGGGKRGGLAAICSLWGIPPEEVLAIGDGENDLSMLQYAGVGVAMGNAAPEIQRRADWVTSRVEQGGVARAIRHFLPELFSGDA